MFVCIGFSIVYTYIWNIHKSYIWIHGIWAKQKDMSSFSARDGILCWEYVKSEQKDAYMMRCDGRIYVSIFFSFLLFVRRFFYLSLYIKYYLFSYLTFFSASSLLLYTRGWLYDRSFVYIWEHGKGATQHHLKILFLYVFKASLNQSINYGFSFFILYDSLLEHKA